MAAPINPKGPKSDKVWRDAIRLAVARASDGKTKTLELLAKRLVAKALDGDMQAMKEIGDRLDGKPAQAIVNGEDGPFNANVTVTFK